MILVFCGLPGSGKTFFAKHLKKTKKFVHINSDVVRKKLFKLKLTEKIDDETKRVIYSEEVTDKVYDIIIQKAISHVDKGKNVILDATFSKRKHQEKLIRICRERNIPLKFFLFIADDATIQKRLKKREKRKSVSDANYDVYLKIKNFFEEPKDHVKINSTEEVEKVIEKIIKEVEDGIQKDTVCN